MKLILTFFLVLLTSLTLLAFNFYRKNTCLEEEVVAHREARELFLLQIAESAASQAEVKSEIERLRSDLASSNEWISELTAQLQ